MRIVFAGALLVWWMCVAAGLPGGKARRRSGEVADGNSAEPSCEELKVMWRLSKRQSRASEITNEIPLYRDPFNENIWDPYYYPTSRSIGGLRLGRFRNQPIFGRIVHKAPPLLRIQDPVERSRAFEALTKMYSDPYVPEPRRRPTAFRLSGGGHLHPLTPQSGSFQHLKEIIRNERARELQEQKIAEQVAAKAAAIKDLIDRKNPSNYRDYNYNYDTDGQEKQQQESYVGQEGVLAFPNLLAPAARDEPDYMPDYGYARDTPKGHSSSFFDTNSFQNDFDGMIL